MMTIMVSLCDVYAMVKKGSYMTTRWVSGVLWAVESDSSACFQWAGIDEPMNIIAYNVIQSAVSEWECLFSSCPLLPNE